MKKLLIVALLVAIIVASCFPKGKLTKRYNTISLIENKDTINKYVKVNAYFIEEDKAETQKPKTIFDLSPQAQAAIIREISKKETATDKFISALNNTLSSKTINTDDIIDDSQIEKRIVISIRNTSHMPADRISRITITLDFDKENKTVRILSCDKLITAYQTLDLGKTNYTSAQNAEVSGNASIGAGTTGTVTNNKDTFTTTANTNAGISGKLSANNSYSEEVLLQQRIVALNTSVSENQLSFYQEGISGIDLTGNILADVKLEIKDLKTENVYSFNGLITGGKFNDPSRVKLNSRTIIYPNITKNISVKVSFEADFRKVINNDKTISESDDRVNQYYGYHCGNDTMFITKRTLVPVLYQLSLVGDKTHMPVRINFPPNGSDELHFNSYNEARDFLLWMRSKFGENKKAITVGDHIFTGIIFGKQDSSITMPSTYNPPFQDIEILPYN